VHALPEPSHPVAEFQAGTGRPVSFDGHEPPEAAPWATVKLLKSSLAVSCEHVVVAVAVTVVPPPGHILVLPVTLGSGHVTP
jgi:hypothetical protein